MMTWQKCCCARSGWFQTENGRRQSWSMWPRLLCAENQHSLVPSLPCWWACGPAYKIRVSLALAVYRVVVGLATPNVGWRNEGPSFGELRRTSWAQVWHAALPNWSKQQANVWQRGPDFQRVFSCSHVSVWMKCLYCLYLAFLVAHYKTIWLFLYSNHQMHSYY